jgi:hypothetical protein
MPNILSSNDSEGREINERSFKSVSCRAGVCSLPPKKAMFDAIYFGKSPLPQEAPDFMGVVDYLAFFE